MNVPIRIKKSITRTLLYALVACSSMAQSAIQQTAQNSLTFATSTAAPSATPPALYVGAGANSIKLAANPLTQISSNPANATVLTPNQQLISSKLCQIIAPTPDSDPSNPNILIPFVVPTDTSNPLVDVNTIIAQMTTLAGQYPLLALAKYDPTGAALPSINSAATLMLVTDTFSGTTYDLIPTLNDWNNAAITSPPVALAAGNTYAFALAANANSQFDDPTDTKRSIAVLQYNSPTSLVAATTTETTPQPLSQINAVNTLTTNATPSLEVDLSAANTPIIAYNDGSLNSISQALIGSTACMCWDETLQRLFVGLTDVRRDDQTLSGGVVGLCTAYPVMSASGVLQNFTVNSIVNTLGNNEFYSAVASPLYEKSNPAVTDPQAGAPIYRALAGINNAAPGDPGFSVDLVNINICLQVLKAAKAYVAANVAESANQLLTYLRGVAPAVLWTSANINYGDRNVDYFLDNVFAGNNITIFGTTSVIANPATPNTSTAFLTAIQTRLTQLIANAKIVNKAYAQNQNLAPYASYTNSLDFIIGFYSDATTPKNDPQTGIAQARNDGNDGLAVSIPQCAVMWTSTGRPYLIVHSVMNTTPTSFGGILLSESADWVYALPLIPNNTAGSSTYPAYLTGTLAAVNNDKTGAINFINIPKPLTYQAPSDYTHMPRRGQTAINVGGGNPFPTSWVKNMFVTGDSVYVTVTGIQPNQQGIFKSTAIFDQNGCIINWTPAERVMGSSIPTYTAMLDPQSANFFMLTQNPAATTNTGASTVQVTQWGQGQASMHGGSTDYTIDALLGSVFSSSSGGVHGIISFDETTYGFPQNQLALMLAYGANTVALVQTGKNSGASFAPITQNAIAATPTIPQNIFTHPLPNIGPMLCGGIVYNPTVGGNAGWTRVYVGGYGGLAELTIPYVNAAGFIAALPGALAAGLAPVPFAGNGPIFAVGETVGRDPVTGNINARYLHLLKANSLAAHTINNNPAAIPPINPVPVTQNLVNVTDGVVLADGTIAATKAGLQFISADGSRTILLSNATTQILQIEALTSQTTEGLACLPAVVYVLGIGQAMPDDVSPLVTPTPGNVAQIWRVAVSASNNAQGGGVTGNIIDKYQNITIGTARPYAQYPNLRLNFTADGSVFFDASSKDGLTNDFLLATAQTAPLPQLNWLSNSASSITDSLSINRTTNFRIGIPRREKATGAWLVPGDWGLRVNE